MGGCAPHPRPLSRWERGKGRVFCLDGRDERDGQDFWVGVWCGIATWFDRLTMSGYAPRSICVECQAFLRVWRRDGSIRVVVPRGFVSREFRGGPPRSVATAACALRPPGPLCQLCHVAAADGRNQASSLSRVSPPGTPCTRPGARRDRPPDGALALLPATVPRPGGQSHQGGQRLPVVLPQFGQLGGQGGGGKLPYARPINRTGPGAAGQDGSAAYALPARRGPALGRENIMAVRASAATTGRAGG